MSKNSNINTVTLFAKSFWYCILCMIVLAFINQIIIPWVKSNTIDISNITFYSFSVIKLAVSLYWTAFFILTSICYAIKSIYNLWLTMYYSLFYDRGYDHIIVKTNKEGVIKEAYLSMKNGDKVPLSLEQLTEMPTEIIKEEINTEEKSK